MARGDKSWFMYYLKTIELIQILFEERLVEQKTLYASRIIDTQLKVAEGHLTKNNLEEAKKYLFEAQLSLRVYDIGKFQAEILEKKVSVFKKTLAQKRG